MDAGRPSTGPGPGSARTPLGSTGVVLITPRLSALGGSGAQAARSGGGLGTDDEDPWALERAEAEANFFACAVDKERVQAARHNYPKRKPAVVARDPLTGEEPTQRRIMGFKLGFEKIFATTSIKLPVSAYTIFVELHATHNNEAYGRCFNGLHTVFDLKKWIYEKLLVPINAYDLSYAEPGKATLPDQLRLLTTQDSLDTRTLATTRAVHGMYKGIPGVHSIDDMGVTRLYVRLRCRTCGELLNSLQTCRKMKVFGNIEPVPSALLDVQTFKACDDSQLGLHHKSLAGSHAGYATSSVAGKPGLDPTIEDCWYTPDAAKHCIFHTRGYEMFEGAQTHGSHAEIARIYISCGKEPSKKLRLGNQTLSSSRGPTTISY